MRSALLLVVCGAALASACGSSASTTKPIGSQGGACRPNGTCDSGLACVGGTCAVALTPDAPPVVTDAPAGPDAAPADAPTVPDAAPPDALPPDALPPDALPPDAAPPDAPAPTTGTIAATWTVTLNGVASTCAAAGGMAVELVTTPSAGGPDVVDHFDCGAGSATTRALAAGSYGVELRLFDATSHALASVVAPAPVVVQAGQTATLAGVIFAVTKSTAGTFTWKWDLFEGVAPVSCAAAPVAAGNVRLVATPKAGGASFVDEAACTLHDRTTGPLPAGQYTVSVLVLDALGQPLGHAALGTKTVAAGQATDLGTVKLVLPPGGGRLGLVWSILVAGYPATCLAAGGSVVEVTLTAFADNAQTVDTFPCSALGGATELVTPDTYGVSLRLLDATGAELGLVTAEGGAVVTAATKTAVPELVFDL